MCEGGEEGQQASATLRMFASLRARKAPPSCACAPLAAPLTRVSAVQVRALYVPCRQAQNSRKTTMLVPFMRHLTGLPVAQVRSPRPRTQLRAPPRPSLAATPTLRTSPGTKLFSLSSLHSRTRPVHAIPPPTTRR